VNGKAPRPGLEPLLPSNPAVCRTLADAHYDPQTLSEKPPHIEPPIDERDWEFLQTLERRRVQSDTIAWTVPGLAV
jgi:hypothetical protein